MLVTSNLIGIRPALALAWLLVCGLGSMQAAEEATTEGTAVGGLHLRLQLIPAEKGKGLPSQCEVVLENVGDSDLYVNLGEALANGNSHHPTALRLLAHSKGNKTQTLVYSLRVAGRLDPFVVPLPTGSTYTLRIAFERFSDSETGELAELTGQDYRIVAELAGEPVSKTRAGGGFALMPFWQGKASSNEIHLAFEKVPAK